jgi:hypothetical protein
MRGWLSGVLVVLSVGCTSGKDEPSPFADSDTANKETDGSDTPIEETPAVETDTVEETETETEVPPLSHATDIQPIWDANCAACHISQQFGFLDLTNGYTSLVGVASGQADAMLVVAGDPNLSYLWAKLNGQQAAAGGFGQQMPDGSVLSANDLETVRTWIEDGALP